MPVVGMLYLAAIIVLAAVGPANRMNGPGPPSLCLAGVLSLDRCIADTSVSFTRVLGSIASR